MRLSSVPQIESDVVAASAAYETAFSIIGLVASIASLVLAVVAIALAIKFFQMSDAQAQRAAEASREISGAVDRLEKLFDRMYSDTFGMVQSMQERIFQMVPVVDKESTTEEPVSEVTVEESGEANQPEGDVREDDRAAHAKKVAFEAEPIFQPASPLIASQVMSILREDALKGGAGLTLGELETRSGRDGAELVPTLFSMRLENKVRWDNTTNALSSMDEIRLGAEQQRSVDQLRKAALKRRNRAAEKRSEWSTEALRRKVLEEHTIPRPPEDPVEG